MIAMWETNKEGEMVAAMGLYEDEAKFREAALAEMAAGKMIAAGDVLPFAAVEFVPAAVTIKK